MDDGKLFPAIKVERSFGDERFCSIPILQYAPLTLNRMIDGAQQSSTKLHPSEVKASSGEMTDDKNRNSTLINNDPNTNVILQAIPSKIELELSNNVSLSSNTCTELSNTKDGIPIVKMELDSSLKRFPKLPKTSVKTKHKKHTYTCQKCKKIFDIKEQWAIHKRYCFSCTVCGKTFSTESYLALHRQMHTKDNYYSCNQCECKFETLQSLKRHQHKLHGKIESCEICFKDFKTVSDLIAHKSKVHSGIPKGTKPFVCEYCGKSYMNKCTLTLHENRVHLGILEYYSCEFCSKKFASQKGLNRHRNTNHTSTVAKLANMQKMCNVATS